MVDSHLRFQVAGKDYAVPATQVYDFFVVERYTPIFPKQDGLIGIYNLRGHTVMLVSFEGSAEVIGKNCVCVSHEDELIAFPVDHVDGVVVETELGDALPICGEAIFSQVMAKV